MLRFPFGRWLGATAFAAFAAPFLLAADLPQTVLINQQIAEGYKSAEIKKPAARASDFEFIRRVFLDLIGRIPTAEEVLDFEQDRSANKRQKLVNRLLNARSYEPTVNGKKIKLGTIGDKELGDYATQHAEHFANHWTVWLLSRNAHQLYRTQLSMWLTDKFVENTPYNQIVKELLTATGESNKNAAVNFIAHHMGDPVPGDRRSELGYNDAVPITSRTTRLFLGLQTQCTQCHDHPFNKEWVQADFWGVNAYFRQVKRDRTPTPKGGGQKMMNPVQVGLSDDPEVNKEGRVFYERRDGRLLGGKPNFLKDMKEAEEFKASSKKLPDNLTGKTRRQVLADYLVAHDNFGPAIVNRMWGLLFGRGMQKDPTIDDFGSHNEVVHKELLAKLSEEFIKYNYNLKALLEWICNSEPYNLSHVAVKEYADLKYDPYFARMNLKALSPEVLYDSLLTATRAEPASTAPGATAQANRRQGREDWLGKLVQNFGDDEGNELTFNGTVVQSLLMMNGSEMNNAITKKGANVVEALVKKHTRGNVVNVNAIVDELFLTTVSRHPTPAELAAIKEVQNGLLVESRDKPDSGSKPSTTPTPKGPNTPTPKGPNTTPPKGPNTPQPKGPITPQPKGPIVGPGGKPIPPGKTYIPGVPTTDEKFYQDLFWALLNTNEFMLNH